MSVLVGKSAPDFVATAVMEDRIIEGFKLSSLRGRYIVLFFYPLDFTFVCPTELHAFNERIKEFRARNVELVAISIDSHFSHYAWLNTPRSKGGIQGVSYPIVSDITKSISSEYDVLVEGAGIAYRGLFLIDKNFVIRHQVVNDLPLGRSVDETLRMIDALQYYEERGEVCPANWQKGQRAMVASNEGLVEYFAGI